MKRLLLIMSLFVAASVCFAQEKRYAVPIDNSPSYGPSTAPVTIVEFLDFQ